MVITKLAMNSSYCPCVVLWLSWIVITLLQVCDTDEHSVGIVIRVGIIPNRFYNFIIVGLLLLRTKFVTTANARSLPIGVFCNRMTRKNCREFAEGKIRLRQGCGRETPAVYGVKELFSNYE